MQIPAKTLIGYAIFVSGATAMSIRQTGGAMNIVNAYGVAMQQSADSVLGWWTSEQPAAVVIQWPTSGNPTALKFANGKCLYVDNVVPYQTDCTCNNDEWWHYENEQ
ncbi:hypothetical protein SARC_03013 [Sphaeroforma arctica JP610]|uniref:Uncharacterized protein n=1 Tax=Sphaeroforma arctica JP610 TaxID=667725 RepID=A0A0L0G7A8_9EUKA|nr:hypothetical protein SARC_03013 [Sphaeroforma arctica JP610]KNC84771.1 hypothetical protein SARC_03013 [Sphaeroforma arctica JP610]|eukprot:XP_014158673.1 hypothetical protein SARC_03013 [Sphaeroforma arctica JP610]